MKIIASRLYLFTLTLLLFTLNACKKADNNGSTSLKSLLIGTPDKVWKLESVDVSTVWEDQMPNGWKQYTNQPGVLTLSECVLNNDYVVFNADNTYTQSTYTCNLSETNFILFKQTGGPGKWTLASDNTLRFENYATYRLISVTATDLFIADLHGTSHFKSVSKLPFISPTQHLAGTGDRTWKIDKIKRGGVDQPLSAAQLANRLTFNINGTLTSAYTNNTYGQPVTGSWNYDLGQSKYAFTFPATGQTAALTQNCTVFELTETAFTYYYFDAQNNYFTIYLVPQ